MLFTEVLANLEQKLKKKSKPTANHLMKLRKKSRNKLSGNPNEEKKGRRNNMR